jgi:vacuolar-type H+-ATPase subunit E/Vma4
MLGGTTIVNMENNNDQILNVATEDLLDELKALVEQAVQQYQEKCLLSFSKSHDRRVI